jgi:hypothetical protein
MLSINNIGRESKKVEQRSYAVERAIPEFAAVDHEAILEDVEHP